MADDKESSYAKVVKSGLKLKGRPPLAKGVRIATRTPREVPAPNSSGHIDESKLLSDHGQMSPESQPAASEALSLDTAEVQLDEDVVKISRMKSMTTAEKTFLIAKAKRRKQWIDKRLSMTHRQRMAAFNAELGKLSEHFDIPKVGPG